MDYEIKNVYDDSVEVLFKFHDCERLITYTLSTYPEEKDVFNPYWGHDTVYTKRNVLEELFYDSNNSITESELFEMCIEEDDMYSEIVEEIFDKMSVIVYEYSI